MSSIPPNNKQTFLAKTRVPLIRGTNLLRKGKVEDLVQDLQQVVAQLLDAVIELQGLQFASRRIDQDGGPTDRARCELFDGQWLRLTQTAAAGMLLTVEHGLRRRPQGVLFVVATAFNRVLIAGDPTNNIQPADEFTFTVELNGSVSDEHICVVF